MDIIVLLKSVIATDEPIRVVNGSVDDRSTKRTINPYDEYALEEALRIKEAQGATVTALSLGGDAAPEALRTALAMGADEAVWIRAETDGLDEYAASALIASALRQRSCDLAFAGHLSVDNGAGQVAIRVAELLGWPHAGAITACEIDGGVARVTRDAEGDSERWEVPLPAVLTAQQGLNEPRYPALAGIMKAKRKPLAELAPDALGGAAAARSERLACEAPPARPAGRKLAGSPREQAAELLELLRGEAKVLERG
ncbi:electron transfer flavoprotein subunit beta/FixA family protein [Cohnella sp. GCM10027633]|uniref:electron transfer flavoprotein subunit beta/FixA family protein n=1 Tax=unclassified Cohnella TaxID=2636738 RepID=UPI003642699D